jgi:hypothetical protein
MLASIDIANRLQQTVMYVLGPDIQAIRDTPTGVPVVEVLLRTTGSVRATAVVSCLLGLLFVCCLTNNVTTGSRQLWWAVPPTNLIVRSADTFQVIRPRQGHSIPRILRQSLPNKRDTGEGDHVHPRNHRLVIAVQHRFRRGFIDSDLTEPHRINLVLPTDGHFHIVLQDPRAAATTFTLQSG